METSSKYQTNSTENNLDKWFDDLINQLHIDHLQLSTKTADADKENFYQNLISNNVDGMLDSMNKDRMQYYISNILFSYSKELFIRLQNNIDKIKIAVDYSSTKLLVWSEIPSENEAYYEDALLLSEAKVSAIYFDRGFSISSTIVSKEDNIKIPTQYKLLN
ncbi:MAG: hypothetical protein H6553_01140 [Chitinophagales bacterium]|nr:hypothetical protein [Chitinophagales bacterium]